MIHSLQNIITSSAILLVMCFLSFQTKANDIIKVTEETQVIGKNIFYLQDVKRELTIEDVWLKKQEGQFNSHTKSFFNRPNSNSNYWFTFSVNVEQDNIWININNNNLDSVHFYLLNDNGDLIKETLTGSILDKSTREFNADTYWFKLIKWQDSSVNHIFLKVFSSMSMEVPIELGDFNALLKNKLINDLYAQTFIGGLLIMFLYNLVLFVIIKDKVYFYYLTYIFGSIFASTSINNYPIIEIFVGQHFAHLNVTSWIWVSFVSVILFTIEYLELKKNSRYIYYILLVYIVILLIFGLIEIFFPKWEISNTYQMFVPIIFVTCLISAYRLLFKGDKKARLYSIGWTILLTSSILYLMVTNGFLPYNTFTRNITYLGLLIEVIIFSIALAKRITILKKTQEELNLALTQKNNALILSNESLDSFNYHVSHDLKTVLNNVSST